MRFPEAFVHPSSFESEKHFSTGKAYKVQLVDEHGRSLEEYIRTVGESSVRRDTSFNPRNIQCFIRECLYRDSYMGAPWLIKVYTTRTLLYSYISYICSLAKCSRSLLY